ncbi:MAG: phosphatidylserine/phosphatidylglycerophosphate/cardiolipin synthase family protein [Deltaproteobacteria bacterium]|nr:phosphatidylserine/phosphatidylglycerophosphate/cardiolipin synthase family protein [Deltaproteobacteria bacterium]
MRPLIDGEPAFTRICEAVEGARKSVWLTVAFLEKEFCMPGGRGSLFDVLDRAAARGIDVRVIFWSEPKIAEQIANEQHFLACADHTEFLVERQSGIRARWDRVPKYCQHQKSWVIDAGEPEATAFVGGINLDVGSVVPPGHPADSSIPHGKGIHDLYCEIRGPAVSDVVHNFVQRWNESSERNDPHGLYPDAERAADLAFPNEISPRAGETNAQITRSVLAGLYRNDHPTPGGERYAVEAGEYSVREQYLSAITAARRTIYFENQLLFCPDTIEALRQALERGIQVVVLVPRVTMPEVVAAREIPRAAPLFEALAALGQSEDFSFVGLATNRAAGVYEDIYVHAKFAAIDDCWATIGSTNTMFRSFKGDTELNVSFWDREIVRKLRCDLLLEHLGEDTSPLDDRQAFARYCEVALRNRERREAGQPMEGQIFAMDPENWARPE